MASPGFTRSSSPSLRVSSTPLDGELHRSQLLIHQAAQLPVGRQPCQVDSLGAVLEA